MATLDPASEVPSTDLLPGNRPRLAPHIYTDAEIIALMTAAGELRPRLRAARHVTLIGLLAVTVRAAEVTGPYAFLETAGPARLAITDRGLTFASNRDRGVLITFRASVHGLEPFGVLRHPELTATVTDVDELAALLRARTVA